jgi:hypothetical protein
MPQGSLIPKEIRGKISLLEKFAPPEVAKQIKILANAERSFVIPIKIVIDDKPKYFIVAGILLKEKVNATPSFDENDLELLKYALEKASKVLDGAISQDKQVDNETKDAVDDSDAETDEGEEA